MKLVVAMVNGDDARACCDALTGAGFAVTRLASAGGFLGRGNATLLIGIDAARVDEVIEVLRRQARGRVEEMATPVAAEAVDLFVPYGVEVQVGGATVFVIDVERFERL
ncbi:MAG TPA: cyclic-di-AMP receptor [Candidatus Dormibacteraeota bacterium]